VVRPPSSTARRRWVLGATAVWAVLQVAIPLRHLAYSGDVRWTEEGYYGSFRVMLTEKAGWLRFNVTDPATTETWTVDPTLVLADWQARQAAIRPELALAAAHLLAAEFAADGHDDVVVSADSWVSFNGRQRQRMIDPRVDLARLSRRAPAATYVLPLDPAVRD
jgi:vitamin K-dependent gamma-carboxylase